MQTWNAPGGDIPSSGNASRSRAETLAGRQPGVICEHADAGPLRFAVAASAAGEDAAGLDRVLYRLPLAALEVPTGRIARTVRHPLGRLVA